MPTCLRSLALEQKWSQIGLQAMLTAEQRMRTHRAPDLVTRMLTRAHAAQMVRERAAY